MSPGSTGVTLRKDDGKKKLQQFMNNARKVGLLHQQLDTTCPLDRCWYCKPPVPCNALLASHLGNMPWLCDQSISAA